MAKAEVNMELVINFDEKASLQKIIGAVDIGSQILYATLTEKVTDPIELLVLAASFQNVQDSIATFRTYVDNLHVSGNSRGETTD